MRVKNYYFRGASANAAVLNDLQKIEKYLDRVCDLAGLTILERSEHSFTPQGHSVAYILAESHIAIHTWPELGEFYVMLSSCKDIEEIPRGEILDLTERAFSADVALKEVGDA